MKIGRNDMCYCGSGKKYKYCCMNRDGIHFTPELAEKLFLDSRIEKHIDIVPSIVVNDRRFRAIWNKVYPRPIKETFHEFTLYLLFKIFDNEWHTEQMKLNESDQHVLINWVKSDFELSKRALNEGREIIDKNGVKKYGVIASGEGQALGQLAYDIYCLQIVNKFPDFMIDRLKDNRAFQGVRYEIAVAAMIARAGFDIEFLDDKVKSERHCEFIAKHKKTGIEIGVEAKSRHRKGVLNEPGEYDYNSEIRGDMWSLFRKACSQKPEELPFIIFIDMNIRPTPGIPLDQKPWNKDLMKMVNDYGEPTEEHPDPYNAIIFTNYSFYYTGQEDMPTGEYIITISLKPETKIPDQNILNDIFESVHNYSKIPEEV